ncbi:hypothetical protein ACOSP7_013121 [Xanthoceras sorbifolium]
MSSSIDHEHHEADIGVSPPKDHRSCSFHEVVNEYKQFVSQQRAMDCNYGAVRPMEVRSRCFLVVRRLGGPKESPQRSRDGKDGKQSFGGHGNRAGRPSGGAAFNSVDEAGFKYVGRDGRYVNNSAKAGSKEEDGSVSNTGFSGISKGKSGMGIDTVKGNGKNLVVSRERNEKRSFGAKGVNATSLFSGSRFEVLSDITNDRIATSNVPKKSLGGGKRVGKLKGTVGSKGVTIKKGVYVRKNSNIGKDASFYHKDPKLIASTKGKEVANPCCKTMETNSSDEEFEDSGVLVELHQEDCKVCNAPRDDLMAVTASVLGL